MRSKYDILLLTHWVSLVCMLAIGGIEWRYGLIVQLTWNFCPSGCLPRELRGILRLNALCLLSIRKSASVAMELFDGMIGWFAGFNSFLVLGNS